eukprot:187972_1
MIALRMRTNSKDTRTQSVAVSMPVAAGMAVAAFMIVATSVTVAVAVGISAALAISVAVVTQTVATISAVLPETHVKTAAISGSADQILLGVIQGGVVADQIAVLADDLAVLISAAKI